MDQTMKKHTLLRKAEKETRCMDFFRTCCFGMFAPCVSCCFSNDQTRNNIKKNEKKKGVYFGNSIEEIIKSEGTQIPRLVADSVSELNRRGGEMEGTYRIPGNSIYCRNLVARYDSGEKDIDLSLEQVETLTSVLKRFLRELKFPVCTYELYDDWIELFPNDERNQLEVNLRFIQLYQKIPENYRLTLKCILSNLYKLTRDPDLKITRMAPMQMSAILGQNIIRPRNENLLIRDMGKVQLSCQFMINSYKLLDDFEKKNTKEDEELKEEGTRKRPGNMKGNSEVIEIIGN